MIQSIFSPLNLLKRILLIIENPKMNDQIVGQNKDYSSQCEQIQCIQAQCVIPTPTIKPKQIFLHKFCVLPQKIQIQSQSQDTKSMLSQGSKQQKSLNPNAYIKSPQKRQKSSYIQRLSMSQQSEEERKRADLKSIFIENVDYHSTKEELQLVFQDCAKIDRITILKNAFNNKPKGSAYISFSYEKGVQRALYLNGVRLRNRAIKIHKKRTNMPGMNKQVKKQINKNILGLIQAYSTTKFQSNHRKPYPFRSDRQSSQPK